MTEFVKLDNNTFFDAVKESLNKGNQVKIPVTGNSMRPFLRNGDIVTVTPFARCRLKKGAIALADWKEGYVLHRVVGMASGTVTLAGDNNLGQVEKVSDSELFAVVSACYRGGKLVSDQSHVDRILGVFWYYLRPMRRMLAKINRMLK